MALFGSSNLSYVGPGQPTVTAGCGVLGLFPPPTDYAGCPNGKPACPSVWRGLGLFPQAPTYVISVPTLPDDPG
jgi:hypothetical protein